MLSKKIKYISLFIMIILSVNILYGCNTSNNKNTPISKTNFYLDTVITIKLYDNVDDTIFNKVFDRIEEIENKMTINKNTSEVIDINSNSGENFVKVSRDTFNVIEKSLYYSELSKGYFDITVGPIVKLWNIGSDDARVPTKDEIKATLPKVDYKKILINKDTKEVMLKDKGMVIDLGGIAKGYVADEVKNLLVDNGVEHGIINLGGNVYTLGTKVDGSKWKIGIQNPLETRGAYIGTVSVSNKSIVTSGIYERFFEKDGKRYHHILSPFTGYPVNNNLSGVSIISDKSIDGDALSTSIFSIGLKEGKKIIENLDGVDAIFITKDKKISITSGLKDNFELVNNSFEFISD
ncbi:FAD:protein FMN transferase [Dethiothermospora halolimnae]|uniref:FAD:protein FMN transferase n=1 Tax=Dethiothermospora halolimnae TaxID=3114390 RepID=UPI003CCC240C